MYISAFGSDTCSQVSFPTKKIFPVYLLINLRELLKDPPFSMGKPTINSMGISGS